MKTLKCLIVMMNHPSITRKYVSKVPFRINCTTTSSLEALTIEEGNVDLVFMDIQMPDLGL
jgi:CheY-like chemotaxis protein